MRTSRTPFYLLGSALLHALILLALILGFEFASPPPVIENSNKNDVINAVILGESTQSKILPNKLAVTKPIEVTKPEPPKPQPVVKQTKPDPIAVKSDVEKKLLDEKALQVKKRNELLTKDLLADIQTQSKKRKQVKAKELKSQFEKTLREQAEKSMRQLMDEKILLQGKENKQTKGEINKYKVLITQAISEQWLVPTQANKRLSCELMIKLAPSGLVLDVQVTKTSGDRALDSSARAAVLKASPLPVPKEKAAFEPFRHFALKVKPENIIRGR